MTICHQLDALESANHKIKAIQQMPQTQIQDRDFKSEETSLKEFVSELNKRMIGVKDLKSRCYQLKLHERITYLLLNTTVNLSQEHQRQAKIKHNLVDWVSDLSIFFCHDQTKFAEEFQHVLKKICTENILGDVKLRRIIYSVYKKACNPTIEMLVSKQPLVLLRVLVRDLKIFGSELLEMESESLTDQ